MYIRTIKRKNKDGSVVEYVQLANNVWNKEKGFAQAQVLHSFGRRDQLDVAALKRLVKSMSRFLDPEDALRLTNEKFIKRFNYVQKKVKETGKAINESNLDEMDKYWNESKKLNGFD